MPNTYTSPEIAQQYANPYTQNGQTFFAQTPATGTANTNNPVVMNPNQISSGTKIDLAQPNADTTNANALAGGGGAATKTIADYVKELTPPETATDTQYQGLLSDIASLTGQDTGRAQAQIEAEQASGATAAKKALLDINNELITKNAEYEKMFSGLGATGGAVETSAVYNAQQAGLQRAKAADIGLITARAQVAQGNLALAQETANRAVAAKFEYVEDQIRVKQAQLQAIAPLLDKQQKIQAAAQERMLADQERLIAERKAQEQAIQNIMIEAAKSGANQQVLASIQKAGSVPEAINIAGESFGAEFRQKAQQQAFENSLKLKELAVSQMNAQTSRMNAQTAKQSATATAQEKATTAAIQSQTQLARSQESINTIAGLFNNKALNSSVGPIAAARGGITLPFGIKVPTTIRGFTGERQDFIGAVEQLRSNLNLNALINAKAQGATFGALSDQELQVLASSASKIGTWAVKDKSGQVTGYNVDEKSFKKELDKINNFAKLDFVLKGGDPNSVGTHINPDGTVFTTTYDGKPQQIYP